MSDSAFDAGTTMQHACMRACVSRGSLQGFSQASCTAKCMHPLKLACLILNHVGSTSGLRTLVY
eukprot:1145025-Pelagomonas_calceolata.AAC.2